MYPWEMSGSIPHKCVSHNITQIKPICSIVHSCAITHLMRSFGPEGSLLSFKNRENYKPFQTLVVLNILQFHSCPKGVHQESNCSAWVCAVAIRNWKNGRKRNAVKRVWKFPSKATEDRSRTLPNLYKSASYQGVTGRLGCDSRQSGSAHVEQGSHQGEQLTGQDKDNPSPIS